MERYEVQLYIALHKTASCFDLFLNKYGKNKVSFLFFKKIMYIVIIIICLYES
jgi:hypothetical protein